MKTETQTHGWLIAALVLMTLALMQSHAWAVAGTGSGFYLEDLGVKIFSLCKNVVVPCLLIGMVVFAGGNIAFGWCQMGPGLSRMLLGGAIVAGGIETILLLVGGNTVVTSLVLP